LAAAETKEHKRDGSYNCNCADKEPAVNSPLHYGVADDSSDQETGNAGCPIHNRRQPAGRADVHTMESYQKRDKELTQSIHVEVVKRAGSNQPPHGGDGEHQHIRRALAFSASYIMDFRATPLRLTHQEDRKHTDDAWYSSYKISHSPSIDLGYASAHHIAQ